SDESRGAGLGLAIAKSLVVAHGGEIEATSEPGQGTEMRFWLPTTR
ncbi:MAG TPA: sensor histidine kinase, partial [Methylomirabilota bacterium]|nr:sensor histidine kinase [Methylomirabilota bacterium]